MNKGSLVKESPKNGFFDLNHLLELSFECLIDNCKKLKIEITQTKHTMLVLSICKKLLQEDKKIIATGVLDTQCGENFGFVRFGYTDYFPSAVDVYISGAIIKKNELRRGDTITVEIKDNNKAEEKYFSVLRIMKINYIDTEKFPSLRRHFEDIEVEFPHQLIDITEVSELGKKTQDGLRTLQLVAPFGKGSRGLLIAEPKAGKTTMLLNIAAGIMRRYAEIHLIILLIDERPEEQFLAKNIVRQYAVDKKNVEVIASNFDESPQRHVIISEIVLEKCKRLAEVGKDVVLLLDSVTRLARAYNSTAPSSGKILTGGVDLQSLQKPKKLLGAARKLKNAGSITVIATALQSTGSKMDEIVTTELIGTGNFNIHLSALLADVQVFPAIDLSKTSTRKYEFLYPDKDVLAKIVQFKKIISSIENKKEAIEILIRKVSSTSSNMELLNQVTTNR